MIRTTRGNVASKRRKKYLKLAKGYVGSNSRLSTYAGEQVVQSFNFAYKGRKLKKRIFRDIWIYRINSCLKLKENNYSKFIGSLKRLDILLNKKMLSLIAFNDISLFNFIESKSKN
jgi:large subunit ribosomal protein L20